MVDNHVVRGDVAVTFALILVTSDVDGNAFNAFGARLILAIKLNTNLYAPVRLVEFFPR